MLKVYTNSVWKKTRGKELFKHKKTTKEENINLWYGYEQLVGSRIENKIGVKHLLDKSPDSVALVLP